MPERLSDYASLGSVIETRLPGDRQPMIVAIAGPAAAGKSTPARKHVSGLNSVGVSACHCPMDGFHLTNSQLGASGLRSVMGRIDTSDATAFAKAVARAGAHEEFRWPHYFRRSHAPIREGIRTGGTEAACVVEGNFILADEAPRRIAARFYEKQTFVDAPDAMLRRFLLLRGLRGGKSESEAREKIRRTNLPNAREMRITSANADILNLNAENAYA